VRRYPVVIGVTMAGLAGVLAYHTSSAVEQLPTQPVSAPGAGNANSGATQHPSGDTGGTPATTPPSTTRPTTASPPPTSLLSATGATEQYGYGALSVKVTMSGGKIVNAQIASLSTAETYSQQLATQVVPSLRREILTAQSAQIATLSGATYTSEAYAASVQSALDKLRS